MREVIGDMFVYDSRKNFYLCITTNGSIKKDGTAVMGRGNALEAAKLYPDLPRILGLSIKSRGNVVSLLMSHIYSFPVKHKWYKPADLYLIHESTEQLKKIADANPDNRYVLPRPGCGNGHADWNKVKRIIDVLPYNVLVIDREK